MAHIALEHVSVSYGEALALTDVTLTFEDNVTTAVIGPSGSGKSTLLQLINALVRPSAGTVRVFGEPITYKNLPELRRQFGYAVQGTGLFPHMTVRDNITLLGRLAQWPADRVDARIRELMALVGLPLDFADRYPHELSGGQQQRVGLCRAMMLNPHIFLLDEPFGALDPLTRADIHQEFLHIQQSEARTIVLVTHDLREAMKLAHRLVILDEGQVVQYGSCDDILENPATEFVRNFVHVQLEA